MTTTQSVLEEHNTPQETQDGLGSPKGIRWLLLVGALVVTVSVVRLVATEWGQLAPVAQFLLLVGGSLWVFATGNVLRHRLHLPVAGSALLLLFTALVPLLAWGAAWQRLVEQSFGWPGVVLGLGVLWLALRRVLEDMVGYRGWFYPAVLAMFLLALPALPQLEARFPRHEAEVFLLLAAALGLLLRAGSRHVNRFFFHRDRVDGRERSISFLPFALLTLVYLAAMSLLSAFPTHLALVLAFVGVALVDTGEEYFQALVRATGSVPERWPPRSLGLLAQGFAILAAAVATAPLDPQRHSLPLVTGLVALRLGSWALRTKSALAHGLALASGIAAYHFAPILVPEMVRQWYVEAMQFLVTTPQSPALVSLGDLALLSGIFGLALVLRPRLTPAMLKVHTATIALLAAWLLLLATFDVRALSLLAPMTASILLAAMATLRRWEILPVLYYALTLAVLAWSTPQADGGLNLWRPESALWAGGLALLFLGATHAVLRGRGNQITDLAPPLRRALIGPPLAVACLLLPTAFAADAGTAGFLLLEAAGAFLVSALLLERRGLAGMASVVLSISLPLLAWAMAGGQATGFALVAQGLTAYCWIAGRRTAPDHAKTCDAKTSAIRRTAIRWGFLANATLGLWWLLMGWFSGDIIAVDLHLLILGLALVDRSLRPRNTVRNTVRDTEQGTVHIAVHRTEPGHQLTVGLFFLVAFPCAFFANLGFDHPTEILMVAATALLALGLARSIVVPRLAADLGYSTDKVQSLLGERLKTFTHLWRAAAWMACLVWIGPAALGLALLLAADTVRRTARAELPHPDLRLITLLLPVLHVLASTQGGLVHSDASLLGVLFTAGPLMLSWLAFAFLALALLQDVLAERRIYGEQETGALRQGARGFGMAAGGLALLATLSLTSSPWLPLLPTFATSVFFLLRAHRSRDPVADGVLATGFFATAFSVLVHRVDALGPELYGLGPGLALIALARLVRRRAGKVWSYRLFTVGAVGVYSTPLIGLLGNLTWGWQIALLLCAVAFGAMSFQLRSRSLLTVSTGALLIDLFFFLIKLRQTEPVLLWLAGIVFGLALMGLAALFEHRHEDLQQRLRIWGHELGTWA